MVKEADVAPQTSLIPGIQNEGTSPCQERYVGVGALCNQACDACDILGMKLPVERSIQDLREELRHLAEQGVKQVTFPCNADCRPDFLQILDLATHYGLCVALMTNGRAFASHTFTEKLVGHPLAAVRVHLFGAAASHDKATYAEGAFAEALCGIRNLCDLGIPVEVSVLLSADYAADDVLQADVEAVHVALEELPLTSISFIPLPSLPASKPTERSVRRLSRILFSLKAHAPRHLRGVGGEYINPIPGVFPASPREVHIGVTKKCNLNCEYCWSHSPFMKEKSCNEETSDTPLPAEMFTTFFSHVRANGCHSITICGEGEPLLYPHLEEVVLKGAELGFEMRLVTNGTLLMPALSKRMIDAGLRDISVSVSAGDDATYRALHTNATERTFSALKSNLQRFSMLKKEKEVPFLQIVNVIERNNIDHIDEMIRFASDVGANNIFFKMIEIREEFPDLLITDTQTKEFLAKAEDMRALLASKQLNSNIGQLQEKIRGPERATGFYTSGIYDTKPCLIGWVFCILSDHADVVPCCGISDRLGNLKEQSFEGVWSSQETQKFRNNLLFNGLTTKTFLCKLCPHKHINEQAYDILAQTPGWKHDVTDIP